MIETQHKIIKTQHKIVETQHKIVETQHKIIETQHKIIETQHKIVETQHKITETQYKTRRLIAVPVGCVSLFTCDRTQAKTRPKEMRPKCIEKMVKRFQPVGNAFQHAVIIFVCTGNVRQRVQNFVGQRDRFQCHAIKNKSKTIQCKALRKCDVIEDK